MLFAKITSVKLTPKAFKERDVNMLCSDVDYIQAVSKHYEGTVVCAQDYETLDILLESKVVTGLHSGFVTRDIVGHVDIEFVVSSPTSGGVVEFGTVKYSVVAKTFN